MNVLRRSVFGLTAVLATVLTMTAAANAPAGRFNVSGPTVYDTKTKLTWQRTPSATKYEDGAALRNHCASADLSAALGGTGWRLPTVKELMTIIDHSQAEGLGLLIDLSVFDIPGDSIFWSATRDATLGTGGWQVNFGNGHPVLLAVGSYPVRCVR